MAENDLLFFIDWLLNLRNGGSVVDYEYKKALLK
jgi:hypothetical protein